MRKVSTEVGSKQGSVLVICWLLEASQKHLGWNMTFKLSLGLQEAMHVWITIDFSSQFGYMPHPDFSLQFGYMPHPASLTCGGNMAGMQKMHLPNCCLCYLLWPTTVACTTTPSQNPILKARSRKSHVLEWVAKGRTCIKFALLVSHYYVKWTMEKIYVRPITCVHVPKINKCRYNP
jgi:hypothetical protein